MVYEHQAAITLVGWIGHIVCDSPLVGIAVYKLKRDPCRLPKLVTRL